jgi:hypothetical protein
VNKFIPLKEPVRITRRRKEDDYDEEIILSSITSTIGGDESLSSSLCRFFIESKCCSF